jgi:hypothetical protein
MIPLHESLGMWGAVVSRRPAISAGLNLYGDLPMRIATAVHPFCSASTQKASRSFPGAAIAHFGGEQAGICSEKLSISQR